ncbi:unnamed protein product [Diabrotica balteata]|uniref:Uncharacterized protein n=1 Tax=Diabrotica balteata TaxID=107213 RepID=A0A9N9SP84_DIABA|nr:unnamed protein product [Diabrotica balteata]
MYVDIIVWYCINGILELALSDAIDEVEAANHFQIFMDRIYSIYSKSLRKPTGILQVYLKADTTTPKN